MRGKRCFDLTKDEMENPTKLVRLCADVPAASTSGSKEYKEEQKINRTAFLNNLNMLYRNPSLNLRCEKWLQEKVSYEALKDKCDGHVCVARSFRSLGGEVFLKVISKCCPQVTRQTWEKAANQDPAQSRGLPSSYPSSAAGPTQGPSSYPSSVAAPTQLRRGCVAADGSNALRRRFFID